MPKLSVIIPCYKARETISKTLHSIAMQSIAEDLEILVINDADNLDYSDILRKFDDLNIVYVQREKNGGCGQARNTGVRHATADFLCFADSDDAFVHPLSLEIAYNKIKTEKADMLVGIFESEARQSNGVALRKMEHSIVWCHSKVYRRQFLLDNNLFFKEELRINEDGEFHQIAVDLGAKVVELPMVTYLWRDNANSITHENLYRNKKTFVDACRVYLEDCKERGIPREKVTKRALQNLCVIYDYMQIVLDDCPENEEDYLAACREWWKLADEITAGVSDEEITKVFLTVMKTQCSVIPSVTLTDFLDKIRAE